MIRFRPAEPQDDYLFYQLRRQVEPHLPWEDHQKWWTGVFEHRFIAYDGPVAIGTIRIAPIPPLKGDGIISIIVAKAERGKGFGTQMLTSIQRVAQDLGFTALEAIIDEDNVPSQRAFAAAGFHPTRFRCRL